MFSDCGSSWNFATSYSRRETSVRTERQALAGVRHVQADPHVRRDRCMGSSARTRFACTRPSVPASTATSGDRRQMVIAPQPLAVRIEHVHEDTVVLVESSRLARRRTCRSTSAGCRSRALVAAESERRRRHRRLISLPSGCSAAAASATTRRTASTETRHGHRAELVSMRGIAESAASFSRSSGGAMLLQLSERTQYLRVHGDAAGT